LKKLLQYIPSKELYYFGLLLFAASLPLSKFTISLAQFIIAGNWVLEGNYRQKITNCLQNKVALILMSIYVIHIIGLWNTSNFNYALNDLRTKVPILVFPFLMASSKALDRKQVNQILFLIWIATLVSTLISLAIYIGLSGKEITDIRQISPLISHIRLALLVCVSICIAVYFLMHKSAIPWFQNNLKAVKIILFLSCFWMLIFIIILESLTGLFVLTSGFIIFCFYKILNSSVTNKIKLQYVFIIVGFFFSSYFIGYKVLHPLSIKSKVDLTTLPTYTKNGNSYTHYTNEKFTENGNYYGLFQCEKELRKAWNERSALNFDTLDKKEQAIEFTLMRYLTSKGLPKDSFGVYQLTSEDILRIENGISNYKIPEMNSIENRAYQLYCEYQSFIQGYNSSGHSLAMRILYWKAALLIIKDNFIAGVGTGDLEDAFQAKYNDINSPLDIPWRHRAHNQYLTMMVAFGVFGFLYFMFWLFAPTYFKKGKLHPIYYVFLFVFLTSMLFEDTLETQAGLSFAIFFSCLFLLEEDNTIGIC
jgi:hypothetical protein